MTRTTTPQLCTAIVLFRPGFATSARAVLDGAMTQAARA
jgi:hypothetical protein